MNNNRGGNFLLWITAFAVLAMAVFTATGRNLTDSTVVVYNLTQPESEELARFYAQARGIPSGQVLGLTLPETEEITREVFVEQIQKPLESAFDANGWWERSISGEFGPIVREAKIRYMILVRGVPLKVARASGLPDSSVKFELPEEHALQKIMENNESSVDSELSAFFDLRNEYPGIVPNPYFRRFSSIWDVPPYGSPLLVTRLDGPDLSAVKRMIESAVTTEKRGLWGWAVIDARGIKSGGYLVGDEWLRDAAALMRRQGIPVIMDDLGATLPSGFPMPDTGVYYGWYTGNVDGPFANPSFRLRTGAIAAHLHSFSASTLRSATEGWTGPLVLRGAAATLGNVYEPLLGLTTHLDLFQDRLQVGFTVGEAAYMGTFALSWMNVFLGDPLYRPYAAWMDLQFEPDPEDAPFIAYRKAVLAAGGKPVAAAPALRQLARSTGNSMFLEALADAQFAAEDATAAQQTLDSALALETRDSVRFRLTWQKITMFMRRDDKQRAIRLVSDALGDFRQPEQKRILDSLGLILQPPPPSPSPGP